MSGLIQQKHLLFVYRQAEQPMVRTFLEAERMYRPSTYMHSLRTALICDVFLSHLKYDPQAFMTRHIVTGALLHDIGKLAIPADLLAKSGRLTHQEWQVISSHPECGIKILPDCFPVPVRDIISMHHEKPDGSGYPLGIKKIPDYVQIVTIVDMFEAMTSKRYYKSAYSDDQACELLLKDAKKGILSIELVNAFVSMRKAIK